MQKSFSIIVPCYNADAYIKDAIDSCFKINYPKNLFEVIIINDGSNDQSKQIIQSLIDKKDLDFKLINNQSNQGLGFSRNRGVQCATKDYVLFLDADDQLYPNVLKNIDKSCRSNEDLVFLNSNQQDAIGNIKIHLHTNYDSMNEILLNPKKFQIGAVFYCYKRDFLKRSKLLFENIIHEDILFCTSAILNAKSFCYSLEATYLRKVRENSLSTRNSLKRAYDLIHISKTLNETFKKVNEDQMVFLKYFSRISLSSSLNAIVQERNSITIRDFLKKHIDFILEQQKLFFKRKYFRGKLYKTKFMINIYMVLIKIKYG